MFYILIGLILIAGSFFLGRCYENGKTHYLHRDVEKLIGDLKKVKHVDALLEEVVQKYLKKRKKYDNRN